MGNILCLDPFALGPAAIFNPSRFGRHVRREFVDGVIMKLFLDRYVQRAAALSEPVNA